ncbi:MAG: selenium binding protein [Enterococcus sp.]
MYEDYTRQAVPERHYRELVGTAVTVFNSNNSFIIENILRITVDKYSWHTLIDYTSGRLNNEVKNVLEECSHQNIVELFSELISMRNRIIHSFQITNSSGKQVLATKEKNGNQFEVTEEYLMQFIKKNEQLSLMLHEFRGF